MICSSRERLKEEELAKEKEKEKKKEKEDSMNSREDLGKKVEEIELTR